MFSNWPLMQSAGWVDALGTEVGCGKPGAPGIHCNGARWVSALGRFKQTNVRVRAPQPTQWSGTQYCLKWFQTVANVFDLVYQGDCGGFVISPARAERSPRPR